MSEQHRTIVSTEHSLTRSVTVHTALRELARAADRAAELERDVWQFAVALASLRKDGLTDSEARWLVATGYAAHAVETTAWRSRQRKFRPGRNLELPARTCLVLTARGRVLVAAEEPQGASLAERPPDMPATQVPACREVPCWNQEEHTLSWRGAAIKRFTALARRQEAVLAAFQAAGWERCIPLSSARGTSLGNKGQLRDTIRNLNRSLKDYFHFGQEGCGSRLCWRPLSEQGATQALPKKNP